MSIKKECQYLQAAVIVEDLLEARLESSVDFATMSIAYLLENSNVGRN
jgi:hypothetical protein